MPLTKYAARVAARLHIWTAAPAPPRLFLPQAAAQLRSQQQLPVSSTGRGRRRCPQLPVSSTGRGRRRCPCSASLHLPQAALGCAAHRPFSGVSSPWLRSLGRGWHGYTKQSRAQQANASRNVNPRDSPGSAWSFIFVRTAQENPIHSSPEIPYNGARGEIP